MSDRPGDAHELARAAIEHHSKSFSAAARLLPKRCRRDAQVLYAYCRRADDAIDEAPPAEQPQRLRALRTELAAIYAGRLPPDPLLAAFAEVAQRRAIPRAYFDDLLEGMEMDVVGTSYHDHDTLLRYCYCVAGTVGLMMCHVMGVRNDAALAHAAHLGIGMQLTNIARDVVEDWQRGRLYLPDELLQPCGAGGLGGLLGQPFPECHAPSIARALAQLLSRADGYYRSGRAGLPYLSARCAFGVRTAANVYQAIGERLRVLGFDPLSGRAVVSKRRKLWLVARAGLATLASLPLSLPRASPRVPQAALADPGAVLYVEGKPCR